MINISNQLSIYKLFWQPHMNVRVENPDLAQRPDLARRLEPTFDAWYQVILGIENSYR